MSLSALHPLEIARICGGYWLEDILPDFGLTHAVIDSRKMAENTLFIALKGSQTDGHTFLAGLDGAPQQAAMVSQPNTDIRLPQLCVTDVEKAFQQLAKHIAHHTDARKIAITGSVGKTGTKDMIATMLAAAGQTHATKGNLNNHLGVPLTLANMTGNADFLVTEMGMNNAGEIALLSEMVRPDIAIITRISNAHAGFFDSLSEIADAKAEIFSGMDAFGTAILPRDDEFYGQLAGSARLCGVRNILSFGTSQDSTIRLEEMISVQDGLDITASLPCPDNSGAKTGTRKTIQFTLGMRGKHYAMNALCALAVVYALNLDIDALLPRFADMQESEGRGRLHLLCHKGRSLHLIDDSYNASPASMLAALDMAADTNSRHLLLIFSDMLELGEASMAEHLGLAPAIEAAGAQNILSIGPMMQACCAKLPGHIGRRSFDTAEALIEALETDLDSLIGAADLILVKGSHGSAAYKISQYLREKLHDTPTGPAAPEGGVFHAA